MRLKMFLYIFAVCCWGKTLTIPQHILNEFKASVLPLFGMKEPPRLDGQKPHIPEALKKLYETQNNLDFETASFHLPGLHTKSANTVRSFVHVESPIDEKFIHHNKFRLKFDISSIPKNEKLKAAEIKVSRESIQQPSFTSLYRLLVYDIVRRGIKGVHPPIMRLIDSKLIDTRENNTISIDVFPAVERWLADAKSNHGVLVVLRAPCKKASTERHLRLRRDTTVVEWWQKQPLLFTYTDDGKNRQRTGMEMTKIRPKRASSRKQKKHERDPCRRRQMYVDFKDVGWSDWIVAPPGYDAFYCAGQCDYPMPEHFNTTNHAIVQSLVNSVKPTEVPKPCCVPTNLSSISMLYVASDNNVILKNYKDMVVVGCGCR